LELIRHIREGWNIFTAELGEYIDILPPMKRVHEDWYQGTADAVFQNFQSIEDESPSEVLIVSGDHIYKMNYREMLDWHRLHGADITIATIQAPPEEASRFGVVEIGPDYRVVGFEEKPQHGNPKRSRFDPSMISASMGVYIFNRETLLDALHENAQSDKTAHDFGQDVIPACLNRVKVVAYDFHDMNAKKVRYWRDVGTLDAYYEANMDLVDVVPEFNLYDQRWPIRTKATQQPPAKFVFAQEGRRMGLAVDSVVSAGCIVSGGRVLHSVLSPGVRVNSYCEVEYSILMPGVEVGRYSRVRRAIVNTGVKLPESSVVGFDLDADRRKGYHVTEGGIVVVA
jgi:glucose-1-phosphate adenylyltransferase